MALYRKRRGSTVTRSVVERVEAIPGATLPAGLVDLMRAENAARRHALAEGHPDPYPLPSEMRARRDAADRARREAGEVAE
jgi:hypothetical protein